MCIRDSADREAFVQIQKNGYEVGDDGTILDPSLKKDIVSEFFTSDGSVKSKFHEKKEEVPKEIKEETHDGICN